MAITAAIQNDLIELSVSMLGRAPGTTLLNTLAGKSNEGMSIGEIADYLATLPEFTAAFPASDTFEAVAATWIARVVPSFNAAQQAEASDIVVAALTAGSSLASLFVVAIDYLNSEAGAAALPVEAATFTNQVAVAKIHSVDLDLDTGNDTVLAGVTDDATSVDTATADLDGSAAAAAAAAAAATEASTAAAAAATAAQTAADAAVAAAVAATPALTTVSTDYTAAVAAASADAAALTATSTASTAASTAAATAQTTAEAAVATANTALATAVAATPTVTAVSYTHLTLPTIYSV